MFSMSEEHRAHLSPLFDQSPQLLQDFCRLALDFLKKGPNLKLYGSAGQKLQLEVNVIQLTVEALVQLIIKCRRLNLSKSDFRDLVLTSGFNEEQEVILSEFYESNQEIVDSALSTLSPTLMHYQDLEWRFDIQVASRALLRQTVPVLTMKLTFQEKPCTGENSNRSSLLLQTDPNNLKHMIKKLDDALLEASSQHSRRLQRIFK
ncbi:hypothetical protein ONE63_006986 [Megalurothrips usitatus]|uniref:COMM domain-containing protein n=1 Tax=Megalurothrips usitatus TaxID=439358 RepID=A0AAV7XVH1_9NEOP|nr:hypothetical protein ONE63_006986 [Megalurothrips usitatus]